MSQRPQLSWSTAQLLDYAMRGDRSDAGRSNFQEAIAVMQFQVLEQQRKTAEAQRVAAIGTLLMFVATVALVVIAAV